MRSQSAVAFCVDVDQPAIAGGEIDGQARRVIAAGGVVRNARERYALMNACSPARFGLLFSS